MFMAAAWPGHEYFDFAGGSGEVGSQEARSMKKSARTAATPDGWEHGTLGRDEASFSQAVESDARAGCG
jgi:hypothetical protein